MFLPFLVRGTPYNGQHMRFLRAVCGRRAALCGEKKGCTPMRDAASRVVAPLPLQSAATACALRESGPPTRFPGFGAPNVSQNHAPCTVSKRVGFAKRKKGRTPARDAASRAVAPSFLCNPQRQRVRCEKAGLRHAFRDSARRMSLKTMRLARFPSASALPTRKKGRTPARDAASGLSFRRWRCFGCGSCGRRCRRGRPAPRACRTRRCARPG